MGVRRFAALALIGLALVGCTSNSAKKHYVLAEKLWTDGKYVSAVAEFDKVTAKDPKGKLGLQALFRSATTESLFLSNFNEAAKKFKTYADSAGADPALAWDALKQIGEILYTKTEQYDRAISHYQELLKKKPDAPEAPEFAFRIAKSHFFLWRFEEAITLYREIMVKHQGTVWAEKSAFEIGVTDYTRGEQHAGGGTGGRERGAKKGNEAYQEAIEAYQTFIKLYPQSTWVPQARFGIANCLEELDQLDAAYHAYEALKTTYPSPKVIAIKLTRIRERQEQRSH